MGAANLSSKPLKWLVTGAAGFIGSHLVQKLLEENQTVVGIDNFSNGSRENLEDLKQGLSPGLWDKFSFIEGDISDFETCVRITSGIDKVLHMAALGSVPRSIKNPLRSHQSNVDGTISLFKACVDNNISRIIYASSSSVYGDNGDLPKKEEKIGNPLSPYAATKRICEIYGQVFHRTYGLSTVGIRFFNVFGFRQNPDSEYAAVIPKWYRTILKGDSVEIFGDGLTSRDFTYVQNIVEGLLKASYAEEKNVSGKIFNMACGKTTSLKELFSMMKTSLQDQKRGLNVQEPIYKEFRPGDIRDSLADISAAQQAFGFNPAYDVNSGLKKITDWYIRRYAR